MSQPIPHIFQHGAVLGQERGDDTVRTFDLGRASIGEAVRRGNEFLHKASLLIPADLAETNTAAGRRRMWTKRQNELRHGQNNLSGRINL
jgi:chorismate-pyruvate lyase